MTDTNTIKLTIITVHDFPPIPDRRLDWCAYFEGCEEDMQYGHGRDEQEAVDDLLENYVDIERWRA